MQSLWLRLPTCVHVSMQHMQWHALVIISVILHAAPFIAGSHFPVGSGCVISTVASRYPEVKIGPSIMLAWPECKEC